MRVQEEVTGVRRGRRAALVAAVAACTSVAIGLGLAGPALAVDPDRLRDGCAWRTTEEQAEHIQTCTFYSTSLGQDVTVQVRPSDNSAGSTEQGVYFLDGLGSNPEYSSWSLPEAGAVDSYSSSYNLVMPAGGAGQWMTNWQQAPTGSSTAPQWDTFIGDELPAYLAANFDVGTTDNAIVGVSMSGAPAVIVGLNHPDVFSVIRSYSGYYQTDSPLGWLAIPLIQMARANIDNGISAMWGLPLSKGNTWADNDVAKRIVEAQANGQMVIISSGDGIPTQHELSVAAALIEKIWKETPEQLPTLLPAALSGLALGIGLEAASFASTLLLAAQTTLQGLPVDYHFSNGTHNWYAWAASAGSDAKAIEDALAASREKSAGASAQSAVPTAATLAVSGRSEANDAEVQSDSANSSASDTAEEEASTPTPTADSDHESANAVVAESTSPGAGTPSAGASSTGAESAVEPAERGAAEAAKATAGHSDDQQAPVQSPSTPADTASKVVGRDEQSSAAPAGGAANKVN